MIGCYCKSFFFNATLNYDVTVLFLAPRSEIILLSAGESFYHDLKESRMQLACFVRKLLKYLENQVKSSNFQLERCRHVQKNLMQRNVLCGFIFTKSPSSIYSSVLNMPLQTGYWRGKFHIWSILLTATDRRRKRKYVFETTIVIHECSAQNQVKRFEINTT